MRGPFTMTEGWERALSDEEAEAFWSGHAPIRAYPIQTIW
jgi:hypothetical protein